ncbi:AvrE-family type 3 secretion system effector [Erwinia amylovora]
MLTGLRTLIKPSTLNQTQRADAAGQQGQAVLRQQQMPPRLNGGGTLQTTANEQGAPQGAGVQQQAASRSTGQGRFNAFGHLPLFRRHSQAAQARNTGPEAEEHEMQPLNLMNIAIPTLPEGGLEQEIHAEIAARAAPPPPPPPPHVPSPQEIAARPYQAEDKSSLGITLDDKRNVRVAAPEGKDVQRALVRQTLGHPKMHYQSVVASKNHQQHTLLDDSGRLMALHSTPGGLIGVAHSRANPQWQREETPGSAFPGRRPAVVTDHALSLSDDGNTVRIGRNNAPAGRSPAEVKLPDRAILSQLSGVHHLATSAGSEAFRLHNDKLYRLTSQEQGWQQADYPLLAQDKEQSKLARQADNALYLVHDDHHLHNLSSQTQSVRFADKISKAAVAADGQALLLLTDDDSKQQYLKLLSRLDSPEEAHRPLNISPPGTTLAAFAQTDALVIAADHQGRLQVALRPGEQSDELNFGSGLNQTVRDRLQQQIQDAVGERFHVQDFIHDGGNQLHALVKDGMDRQHAVALSLDPARPHAASSWNLSDSMVMDFQKGLPEVTPGRGDIVNMGNNGQLALQDGKVHFFNQTTGGWEASEVKADQLRAGQDGQAWVLKDNELKRLKVNLSSNKINFDQNAFSLHQVKKSVSEDLAMPGLDKNQATVSASVLDNGRYVTLQDNGDIHSHHVNTETRRDKQLARTLDRQALSQAMNHAVNVLARIPAEPQEHKVTDMAIGPDNRMFILSDKGKLFSLPAQSWQQGQLAGLREEKLPEVTAPAADGMDEEAAAALPSKLHGNQKDGLLLALDNGKMMVRGKEQWQPVSSQLSPGGYHEDNLADRHYDRLSAATRDSRLGKTGLTFKREVNTFGQSGHDGHKVHTPFRTRLSTFVFRPTLETPRPLKNMGNLIQHAHSGRKGLTGIYQQQTQQLAELNQHLQQQANRAPEQPLSLKLKTLSGKADLPAWFAEMQQFNTTLADSAAHQAGLLHQQYGTESGAFKQQLGTLTSSLNPASSRNDDLVNKLNLLFSQQPSGKGNTAQVTLASLQKKGVVLSHQKPAGDIPAALHRDKHDSMGLVKSRLILDGLTNAKMHDLAGRLSTALDLQDGTREQALKDLGDEFRTLRDDTWEKNPVKQVTSQGFTGNDRLESNYDAIKSMTKAFTKQNHGMNVTTRTVMQADDQQTLARRLQGTVLSMEKGESISFSRAYGAATTITGIPGTQVIAGVGGRGNLDRGYSLSMTRGEGGINVSFGRDGGGALTAFTGVGYNLLTDYMKDSAHDVPIDHERDLSPAVRLGGVFSATPLDLKKQNSVSFDITEAELPEFIEGLTEGTLDPLALLNRGINHSVKHGDVMNVSLDANAAALASAGIPLTNNHEKETPASFRVGGGAYAGVNILSGTRERGQTTKEDSVTDSRSNNRLRGLNKASVGANFALPTGVLIRSDDGRVPLFAGPAASVQLSIDNRTKQSLTLETKNAQPLEPVHLDKLIESLGKNFSDPAAAALMESLKDKKDDDEAVMLTPRQKLDKLDAHFTPRNSERMNNGQQAALRDLDKHLRQQTAAERGHKLLQNGEYQTTYANLSKVDNNGLWHQLSNLLDGSLNASNANKMRELMGSDHQLQTLIASLQDNVSTDATVTLELKDEVRERLEKRWLEQGNSPEEMTAELTNRDNLRLKSIAFTKSQVKTDGFATPAFLLGGSNNASVSMKRNLGKINFSYGENQDTPTQYSLDGRIAKATTDFASALRKGQDSGYVLKG